MWLAELVRQHPETGAPSLGDPMRSIEQAFEMDSETGCLQAFLVAWHETVRSKRVTLNELSKLADATRNRANACWTLRAGAGKWSYRPSAPGCGSSSTAG